MQLVCLRTSYHVLEHVYPNPCYKKKKCFHTWTACSVTPIRKICRYSDNQYVGTDTKPIPQPIWYLQDWWWYSICSTIIFQLQLYTDTNWQNRADLGQYCCWSNYQWTTNLLRSGTHPRIRLVRFYRTFHPQFISSLFHACWVSSIEIQGMHVNLNLQYPLTKSGMV